MLMDKPNKNNNPQQRYIVTVEGKDYFTAASNPNAAMAKVAFRYARDVSKPVSLIKWRMNRGEITAEIRPVENRSL
jgi:hypothetical protein